MAKNFVSHTNGTVTIDGSTGQNNKMERGGSVVSNPIWEPAAPNSPEQRFDSPKWERHQKLRGIGFATGAGYRSSLPPDEQHLSREERGQKAAMEAKAAGRNIERLPDKAYF